MIPGQSPKVHPWITELLETPGLVWEDLGRVGLKIAQLEDSFRFGEEQVCLAHWAAELLTPMKRLQSAQGSRPIRVADPGSGSGILTLLISALVPGSKGIAIELMDRPYRLLQANLIYNELIPRFEAIQGDLRVWAKDGVPKDVETNAFDLVLANPPYFLPGHGPTRELSSEGAIEVAVAREESRVSLDEYLQVCRMLMSGEGTLAMIHRPERLRDCFAAAEKAGLRISALRAICPKAGAKPSAVLLAAKKNSSAAFTWQRDLILRNEDGDYMPEVASFYDESGQ